jgi:hypothetical protein
MASSIAGLPAAQPLFAEDLPALCRVDEALIQSRLKSRPVGSKVAVALLPDIETIQWHHAREEFVGMELHGNVPKSKGAIVGTEPGKRVWCYWTRVWHNANASETKDNVLHVLRLVVEDDAADSDYAAAISALLAMAQQEAEKWKLEHVELWNPSALAMAGAQRLDPNARVTIRDTESIASMQWHPEHSGPVADKIDWISNEKYAWC